MMTLTFMRANSIYPLRAASYWNTTARRNSATNLRG